MSFLALFLNKEQFKQVGFFVPEELFSFLMTLEAKKTGVRKDQDLDSKELLTAKEVEKMLAISVKTIYSYVQRGIIPHLRIQSNVRFLRSEILDWIAERRFRPKSPPSQE